MGSSGDYAPTLMKDGASSASTGRLPAQLDTAVIARAANQPVLLLNLHKDWMAPPGAVDHVLYFFTRCPHRAWTPWLRRR